MVESQLAFAGKPACQTVAGILHGTNGWMAPFLNRLQTARKPVTVYDQMLAEFRSFMEEDRGLSPATVKGCCSSVRPFLIQLADGRRSFETITVSDVSL